MTSTCAPAIPGVTIDFASLSAALHAVSHSAQHGQAWLQQAGQFFSNYKGRGMEFAEVRPYQIGDDVRSIDWRVTARTSKTHTKLFHEERQRPIWFVVDQSTSLYFGSQNCFKSVQACLLATQMAWHAQQLGDSIGCLVFAESGQHQHLPTSDQKGWPALLQSLVQYNQALHHLCNTDSQNKHNTNQAPHTPLTRALTTVLKQCKPQSFVVLISDFADLNDTQMALLQQLAHKTHLLCYWLYDPLEATLPEPTSKSFKGSIFKYSTFSHSTFTRRRYWICPQQQSSITSVALDLQDSTLQENHRHAFQTKHEQLKHSLRHSKSQLLLCSTAEVLMHNKMNQNRHSSN